MEQEIIYLKLEKNVEVTNPEVHLEDIATLYCKNEQLLLKAKQQEILNLNEYDHMRCVMSSMRLIAYLQELDANCMVQLVGETDIVIEHISCGKSKGIWRMAKILFVCLVCFFGTSFTIMSYHNDIGINNLFAQYYEMVTGQPSSGFTILELSYSIGLAAGILIFFNHIGPRRITKDPTPIEVQMSQYEADVNATLVDSANKGGKIIDVS
ncbi:MAG: stage V sporulation protein AA [Eubacteriales bacterium]